MRTRGLCNLERNKQLKVSHNGALKVHSHMNVEFECNDFLIQNAVNTKLRMQKNYSSTLGYFECSFFSSCLQVFNIPNA